MHLRSDARDHARHACARRPEGPLRRHRTALHRRAGDAAARLAADPPHARRARRRAAVEAPRRGGLRQLPRRGHRQSGDADGARRAEGDLPFRLAGRGRRQQRRRDVSRPVALPGELRTGAGAKNQSHAAARRPDRDDGRQALGRDLVRADRRRRRGRLRRSAQRVRDHEGATSRRAPPACTSRTSSPRRRSAVTWAARC